MSKTTAAAAPGGADGPVQMYQGLMRFVRARFRLADEVQDVVQDAYLRLTLASGRDEVRDPGAFLRTAAINLIRDRARAHRVRPVSAGGDDAADVPCPLPSVERALLGRERLMLLEKALGELPLKRRAAVVLCRIDSVSHQVAADRLGISVSMVEKHVRLGLAHCRQRLAEAEQSE